MLGWGQTLRRWYGHSASADRQLDVSNDYIGYYTDNGTCRYLLLLCSITSCCLILSRVGNDYNFLIVKFLKIND